VCNAGFTAPMNGTEPMDCRWKQCTAGEVPSSPFCSNALFLNLVSPPSFRSLQVSSSLGSSPWPTYDPLGGPQGNGHVSFDRSQSQFLDGGPRTLNIATNGGLTIVAVVRFTGTPLRLERIIQLGERGGQWDYQIMLHRCCLNDGSIPSQLEVTIAHPAPWIVLQFQGPVIEQNSWSTVVFSYHPSTNQNGKWYYGLTVNGITAVKEHDQPMLDSAVGHTLIGRGLWNGYQSDPPTLYSNYDVAGVFVVDEYLSAETASAIADDMVQGVDLSNSELCDAGPCVQCEAGTYKRTVGLSSALTLSPTLYVC
jgi:hypothetical protein